MNKMLNFAGIFQQQDVVTGGGGDPDPVVVNVTHTDFQSNSTAHVSNFPASTTSGNLLLIICSFDASVTISGLTGWSQLVFNSASQATAGIYAKVSNGTEGGTTIDITTSALEAGSVYIYQISNWQGTIASGTAAATPTVGGSGNTRACPALTTGWGAVATLWIVSCHRSQTWTVTSAPTNFTNLLDSNAANGTGGGQTGSARRLLAANDLTPGNFTMSGSGTASICTNTIAIRGTN